MNIAVTQRTVRVQGWEEFRDCLDWRVTVFLEACGLTAVPVPTLISSPAEWLSAVNAEGILLSGGNDLVILGGDDAFPERDALEHALLDFAVERHIPVFGICRGLQIMASHYRAEIVPIAGHVRRDHSVKGVLNRTYVNSFHKFGLVAEFLPEKILPLALSEDGGIEAIQVAGLAQAAVMWHPEREKNFAPDDIELAGSFFRSRGRLLL